MNRFLALALTAALFVPACGGEKELTEEELAAKIERKLKEADTRLLNNKPEDAQAIFDWVLAQDPNNSHAMAGMGRIKLDKQDFAGAEELLKKATAANAEDHEAQYALGEAYAGLEDPASAADAYGKAFALDSENAMYGLKYGANLVLAGKAAEAEPVLTTVGDLDPNARFVWTELGDSLRAQGKHDQALKTYMKAQNTYASDTRARAGAGFVYEQQGQITLAIDEWASYIRMDCCSTYSDEVAKPKLEELRNIEAKGGGEGAEPVEGEAPAEDAAPAEDE